MDKLNNERVDSSEFYFYIAGLLEGDGHISLPHKGFSILNRILNPRIVFTSHIADIDMYKLIQKKIKRYR